MVVYRERMTFEQMLDILGKDTHPRPEYNKEGRYAYIFPNTVAPLTPDVDRELAGIVISLSEKVRGKK